MNFEKTIYDTLQSEADQDSHTEYDAYTFHPSQAAMCKRQMVLSKLGISKPSPKLLGIFRVGTLIHEWLEENLPANLDTSNIEVERSVSTTLATDSKLPDIEVVGHSDLYIPEKDCVVDYKTQSGWYYFDPRKHKVENEKRRHLAQLNLYMECIGAQNGKLVYIDKGKFEPRQYPQDNSEFIEYDARLVEEIVTNVSKVVEYLHWAGFPNHVGEIPFDKCGCYVCDSEKTEELDFRHLLEYNM
jgi:hypothetical protein